MKETPCIGKPQMSLKQWAIEQGGPRKLTQWLIDTMDNATKNFEEDPSNEEKRNNVINKQNELRLQH